MPAIGTLEMNDRTDASATPDFARPRVLISACLAGNNCRYDGQLLSFGYRRSLEAHVELVPLCPEMGIGLPVPRNTIRLERHQGETRLIEPQTGTDHTEAMHDYSRETLSSVGPLDGAILKRSSPSCGLTDAKLYSEGGKGLVETGSGLFTGSLLASFPNLAREDEARLTNRAIREAFLTSIFVKAAFRELERNPSAAALTTFQAEHKFLLQAQDEVAMRKLGQIAASASSLGLEGAMLRYREQLDLALAKRPSIKRHCNVLEHLQGFFKKRISSKEKRHFEELLTSYRNEKLPLSSVTSLLRSWCLRFGVAYLAKQRYFEPFPAELLDAGDSGHPKKLGGGKS